MVATDSRCTAARPTRRTSSLIGAWRHCLSVAGARVDTAVAGRIPRAVLVATAVAVVGSTCKRTAHRVASRCLLLGPSLGAAPLRGLHRRAPARLRARAPGAVAVVGWPVAWA